MQADIAGRVVRALGVALGDSAQQQLTERPTQNLAAYDAYLKGEELSQAPIISLSPLRRAVTYYEQATALDSTFGLAWAQLARVLAWLRLRGGVPSVAEEEAVRRAAERALALAPDRAESHLAMGGYHATVTHDLVRALEEFRQAQRLAPNNADALTALANVERRLSRWEDALEHLRQAQTLDPRSLPTVASLSSTLINLRRYPEAREVCDRIETLSPAGFGPTRCRIMVSLGQGNLAGARTALAAVPKTVDPAELVASVATYGDLYWVLDDTQQQLLLRLPPSAFDNDRATWAIVRAQTYWRRGDQAKARVYADSSRIALEQQLRAAPQNALGHVILGLALAYLGRKTEAIREGQRGVALVPMTDRAEYLPYVQHQLVRIYLLVGELEKALDQLEPLLQVPHTLSPGWLRIDPTFDPLRGNPRFQRLTGTSQ